MKGVCALCGRRSSFSTMVLVRERRRSCESFVSDTIGSTSGVTDGEREDAAEIATNLAAMRTTDGETVGDAAETRATVETQRSQWTFSLPQRR